MFCNRRRFSYQRPARDRDIAKLRHHIIDDAVVRRRRRRQHRQRRRKKFEQLRDAPVIGTEVVPPIRDAVRLIDDEQPDIPADRDEHVLPERVIGQPFRRDQQHIDLIPPHRRNHRLPIIRIRRIDRRRPKPDPRRRRKLVPHQAQQRRNDQRRPRPPIPQQPRSNEVNDALPPPSPLHDEQPLAPNRRFDALELLVAKARIVAPNGHAQVIESRCRRILDQHRPLGKRPCFPSGRGGGGGLVRVGGGGEGRRGKGRMGGGIKFFSLPPSRAVRRGGDGWGSRPPLEGWLRLHQRILPDWPHRSRGGARVSSFASDSIMP